ncbi:alanine racemase [Oceanobacillus sp. CAU 1775]
MKSTSFRDTWAEISLSAINQNVRAFKQYINKNSKMMAVVKADGYGHGAVEVAKEALKAGADYLAVALLDEAIALREAGITASILVLGYTKPEVVKRAIENDITLTVYSEDVIKELVKATKELQKTTKIHLKIDTGMTRLGVTTREDALELLKSIPKNTIEVEGIYTHFATADELDTTFTQEQYKRFLSIVSYLEEKNFRFAIKHCCNSAATVAFPEMHLDMCRVGISMYGLYPADSMREKIKLTQAMTLKTKPVLIRQVEKEQSISYGATYKSSSRAMIATLPIGYADGLSRRLSNRGEMSINAQRVPIVGRVCMDLSMIDVTKVEDISKESEVVVFGEPREGHISLDEVAELLDTIHYEIVCLIGKRVPRVYI